MEIYQFIAPAIAIYYIVKVVDGLKSKRQFIFTTLCWLGFWILITVLSIMPHELSTKLADLLGFKSHINAIIFIALGFLIVLSFYLSSKLQKLDTQMTSLIRQLALDERRILDLESKKNLKIVSKTRNKDIS